MPRGAMRLIPQELAATKRWLSPDIHDNHTGDAFQRVNHDKVVILSSS